MIKELFQFFFYISKSSAYTQIFIDRKTQTGCARKWHLMYSRGSFQSPVSFRIDPPTTRFNLTYRAMDIQYFNFKYLRYVLQDSFLKGKPQIDILKAVNNLTYWQTQKDHNCIIFLKQLLILNAFIAFDSTRWTCVCVCMCCAH